MSVEQELKAFYDRVGFGEVIGKRPLTVPVYTGCMLVPLPNIEARNIYLKYHDLHHVITGFSVGRIGEGRVSAWELGTGSFLSSPLLGFMNLVALSTGLFLDKQSMWDAFCLGCRSRNLYSKTMRHKIDSNAWDTVAAIKEDIFAIKPDTPPHWLRLCEFGLYAVLSMMIHALLVLPAMLVRFITDFKETGSVIKTLEPKKRPDLF